MRSADDPYQGSARAAAERARAQQEHEQAEPSSSSEPEGLDASRAWHATRDFVQATVDLVFAMGGLLRSELSVARAAWPRMIGLLLLVAMLRLSLWFSCIALLAWGLYALTGSVAWALVALIVVHAIALWLALVGFKRAARHMSLPETRSEVHELLHRASHSS